MDYKYIKYKTKYFELKNTNINNQFGGLADKKQSFSLGTLSEKSKDLQFILFGDVMTGNLFGSSS